MSSPFNPTQQPDKDQTAQDRRQFSRQPLSSVRSRRDRHEEPVVEVRGSMGNDGRKIRVDEIRAVVRKNVPF